MGHMGLGREAHQPTRGWRAPHLEGVRIGVGKGAAPPFPSPSPSPSPFPSLVKGRGGVRIGLGVLVGLLPTWEGGASRHTIVPSCVRCPPPQFTPPVIFS